MKTRHTTRAIELWLTIVLAVSVLCGCSGGGGTDVSLAADELQAGAASVLPAPSTLPRAVSEPPTNNNMYCAGEFYATYLPHDNLDLDLAEPKAGSYYNAAPVTFNPQWSGEGNRLAQSAYACFDFYSLQEYDRAPKVNLHWASDSAGSEVYVAIADFPNDRWRWFPAQDNAVANVGSIVPYLGEEGRLVVLIVVLGTESLDLNYVFLGEPFLPEALLQSDYDFQNPQTNLAPLTVNWTCPYSQSVGGTLTLIEYDFEGDGSYEHVDEGDFAEAHTYTEPGTYTCRLRVTDSFGVEDTDELTFRAVDPANTLPVADIMASETSGDAPLPITFDASNSSDNDGIARYQWDLDGDGEYEFDTLDVPTYSTLLGRRGAQFIAVRVTDTDFATDEALVAVSVTAGWRFTTIDSDVGISSDDLCIATSGSGANLRACVAWHDYDDQNLYFSRALAEDGSSWSAALDVVAGSEENLGHRPSMIANPITAVPMVAYGSYDDLGHDSLHFAKASSVLGDSWGAPVQVSGEEDCGETSSLTVAGTRPAIIGLGRDGVERSLLYYIADDATGASWSSPVELPLADVEGSAANPTVFSTGSSLVLAYSLQPSFGGSGPHFVLTSTTAIDGTGWSTPLVYALHSDGYSFANVAGQAALFTGSSNQNFISRYMRSNNAAGDSWPEEPLLLHDTEDYGGFGGMAVINGTPMICFRAFEGQDLWVQSAVDNNGDTWGEAYRVDTLGVTGESCCLVSVNGLPVIAYYDSQEDSVNAAWWQD